MITLKVTKNPVFHPVFLSLEDTFFEKPLPWLKKLKYFEVMLDVSELSRV